MKTILTGAVRPSWLSGPLLSVGGRDAPAVAGTAPEPVATQPEPRDPPAASLYAVCLEASDTRCDG